MPAHTVISIGCQASSVSFKTLGSQQVDPAQGDLSGDLTKGTRSINLKPAVQEEALT